MPRDSFYPLEVYTLFSVCPSLSSSDQCGSFLFHCMPWWHIDARSNLFWWLHFFLLIPEGPLGRAVQNAEEDRKRLLFCSPLGVLTSKLARIFFMSSLSMACLCFVTSFPDWRNNLICPWITEFAAPNSRSLIMLMLRLNGGLAIWRWMDARMLVRPLLE